MQLENMNGWIYEIVCEDLGRITDDTVQQLQGYDADIYWNSSTCKHWIFDFKINDILFENAIINYTDNKITLHVY